MTETRKEDYVSLDQVPCIYYPLYFWKDIEGIRVLIDSGSKVNNMTPTYARHTNIRA